MFAANKPGEYGLNESILVVVRFSKPVVVTGNPTLTLQVTDTSTAVATLKVEVSNDEVRIELLSTDIVFEYFVQEGDTIPMIHHSGPNALFLPNGSAILQLTSFPSLPADILLRDFTDMSTSYGKIERQWMSNFPHKVEVLLRDLHHTAPASLTALIEHNGAFAEIFDAPCPGKVFGVTYPGSRLGNNATAIQPDADIGFDYFFSDSRASNLALFGIVRQSSTLDNYTASLAVDGNRDPYLADMSVSSTLQELQPWWLLQLPSGSSVRTISITPRSAESWSPPVLSFTVKQLTVFPRGFFKLTFADINLFDPSINTTTPFISFGANATELANILEATPGLGSVLVTLKVIQMCGTIVLYRCSDDSEFGFGYKYTIQLLDILVNRL